jgi:hypothetical protein
MDKKKITIRTKELFLDYLKNNNYYIEYDYKSKIKSENGGDYMLSGVMYSILPLDGSNTQYDYLVDNLLEAGINEVYTDIEFLNFLKEVLNNGEGEVALQQAIKKTPRSKKGYYNFYVNNIIESISASEDVLFNYINRQSFLEHSWKVIDDVFPILNNDEYKKTILNTLTKIQDFVEVNTQKSIYKSVHSYLKDPSQFDTLFTKIHKPIKNRSVVDAIDTSSIIILKFTEEKLLSVNMDNTTEIEDILKNINSVINDLKKKHNEDLQIIKAFLDYDFPSRQNHLNIICPPSYVELNKVLFEKIINDFSQMNNIDEIRNYRTTSLDMSIAEAKAYILHKDLDSEMKNNHENTKHKKNKI